MASLPDPVIDRRKRRSNGSAHIAAMERRKLPPKMAGVNLLGRQGTQVSHAWHWYPGYAIFACAAGFSWPKTTSFCAHLGRRDHQQPATVAKFAQSHCLARPNRLLPIVNGRLVENVRRAGRRAAAMPRSAPRSARAAPAPPCWSLRSGAEVLPRRQYATYPQHALRARPRDRHADRPLSGGGVLDDLLRVTGRPHRTRSSRGT